MEYNNICDFGAKQTQNVIKLTNKEKLIHFTYEARNLTESEKNERLQKLEDSLGVIDVATKRNIQDLRNDITDSISGANVRELDIGSIQEDSLYRNIRSKIENEGKVTLQELQEIQSSGLATLLLTDFREKLSPEGTEILKSKLTQEHTFILYEEDAYSQIIRTRRITDEDILNIFSSHFAKDIIIRFGFRLRREQKMALAEKLNGSDLVEVIRQDFTIQTSIQELLDKGDVSKCSPGILLAILLESSYYIDVQKLSQYLGMIQGSDFVKIYLDNWYRFDDSQIKEVWGPRGSEDIYRLFSSVGKRPAINNIIQILGFDQGLDVLNSVRYVFTPSQISELITKGYGILHDYRKTSGSESIELYDNLIAEDITGNNEAEMIFFQNLSEVDYWFSRIMESVDRNTDLGSTLTPEQISIIINGIHGNGLEFLLIRRAIDTPQEAIDMLDIYKERSGTQQIYLHLYPLVQQSENGSIKYLEFIDSNHQARRYSRTDNIQKDFLNNIPTPQVEDILKNHPHLVIYIGANIHMFDDISQSDSAEIVMQTDTFRLYSTNIKKKLLDNISDPQVALEVLLRYMEENIARSSLVFVMLIPHIIENNDLLDQFIDKWGFNILPGEGVDNTKIANRYIYQMNREKLRQIINNISENRLFTRYGYMEFCKRVYNEGLTDELFNSFMQDKYFYFDPSPYFSLEQIEALYQKQIKESNMSPSQEQRYIDIIVSSGGDVGTFFEKRFVSSEGIIYLLSKIPFSRREKILMKGKVQPEDISSDKWNNFIKVVFEGSTREQRTQLLTYFDSVDSMKPFSQEVKKYIKFSSENLLLDENWTIDLSKIGDNKKEAFVYMVYSIGGIDNSLAQDIAKKLGIKGLRDSYVPWRQYTQDKEWLESIDYWDTYKQHIFEPAEVNISDFDYLGDEEYTILFSQILEGFQTRDFNGRQVKFLEDRGLYKDLMMLLIILSENRPITSKQRQNILKTLLEGTIRDDFGNQVYTFGDKQERDMMMDLVLNSESFSFEDVDIALHILEKDIGSQPGLSIHEVYYDDMYDEAFIIVDRFLSEKQKMPEGLEDVEAYMIQEIQRRLLSIQAQMDTRGFDMSRLFSRGYEKVQEIGTSLGRMYIKMSNILASDK